MIHFISRMWYDMKTQRFFNFSFHYSGAPFPKRKNNFFAISNEYELSFKLKC